jgi:aminomethyltransferase
MRPLPLREMHLAMGATMTEWAGGEWCDIYKDATEEHSATRERVALFDWTPLGEVDIRGPRALDFVDYLVTNHVRDLRLGQVRYTPIAMADGTLLDDSTVYFLRPDHIQMIHGLRPDLEWFQQVAKNFGVELADITEQRVVASLQGPASFRTVSRLTTANLAPMRWFHFTYAMVGEIPCRISRTGYHGELGYEIAAPPERGEKLWRLLLDAGAQEGLMPAGFGAVDTLRLDKGYLVPLVDFDHRERRVNVLESGLGWAVDFEKADFVGKAALMLARDKGLMRGIVYFESDAAGIAEGDPVLDGDRPVGMVHSGAVTPTVGHFVGFALVSPPRKVGDTLAVRTRDGTVPIRVVRKGLYDPNNERLRARSG